MSYQWTSVYSPVSYAQLSETAPMAVLLKTCQNFTGDSGELPLLLLSPIDSFNENRQGLMICDSTV